MKILLIDIETMAALGWFWGQKWQTDIIEVEQPSFILSFSYKWLGGKNVVKALPDYKRYKPFEVNDRDIIVEIRDLLDEADFVVAHNGKSFDCREINRRIMDNNLTPPSPYKVIDTKLEYKRVAKFASNKADDLGAELQLGRKLEHEGWALWKKCYAGDMNAWSKMKRYNKQDVELLEKLFLKIRPWLKVNIESGQVCPKCGSTHLQSRGHAYITLTGEYKSFQCQNCGGWGRYRLKERNIDSLVSI